MKITSQSVASMVIAGLAVGGTTLGVIANAQSPESNLSNISTPIVDETISAKLAADVLPTPNPNAPVPIGSPTEPVVAPSPPPFNSGGSDDGDDETYTEEDAQYSNDDSDDEGYDNEDSYDGEDHENSYGDEDDEEEDD